MSVTVPGVVEVPRRRAKDPAGDSSRRPKGSLVSLLCLGLVCMSVT